MKVTSYKLILLGIVLCSQLGIGQDSLGIRQVASIYDYWGFRTNDVVTAEGLAFVACRISGIQVLEVGGEDPPNVVGNVEMESAMSLDISGDYLYSIDWNNIIRIMTIAEIPQLVGTFESEQDIRYGEIMVADEVAYVSTSDMEICIYDVSNPENVSLISIFDIPVESDDLEISDDLLYVAYGNGLLIIDVSDLGNPEIISNFETDSGVLDMAVTGDAVLLAMDRDGLWIIDVTNPENPELISIYDNERAYNVIYQDEVAYLITGFRHTVDLIDISDLEDPIRLNSVYFSPYQLFEIDLADDQLIGICGGDNNMHSSPNGLYKFDISDPENPGEITSYLNAGMARKMVLDGNTAFVVEGLWNLDEDNEDLSIGFTMTDINNPENLRRAGSYDERIGDVGYYCLAVSGDFAYAGDRVNLDVIDISNRGNPQRVGRVRISCTNISIFEETAYIISREFVHVLDISDPENIEEISRMAHELNTSIAGIFATDEHLFFADREGFYSIDVSNPDELEVINHMEIEYIHEMDFSNNNVFLSATIDDVRGLLIL